MRGTKTFIASLLFTAASISFAATPDYFPLQTGNSWVCRNSGRLGAGNPQTIDIQGTQRFNNRDYFRVSLFGRIAYLRSTDTGINVYNTADGQERTWIQFDAAQGQVFQSTSNLVPEQPGSNRNPQRSRHPPANGITQFSFHSRRVAPMQELRRCSSFLAWDQSCTKRRASQARSAGN